ncbi:MAG: glycerol-3-phosphate 1-O-acyltransferase PlsY [Faecalibacterium sp.]|jgi:glycerol-3-phosphate acyltransferase PlsY|nr:glycerol-3-phosphate 1-O-acyltransferase PlsY [Faecalibacterium sp.]
MMEIGASLAVMLEAYLLGSIDTGIIVSKLLYRDDVRAHGSGAAGMTNMLRTFGKKAAALTAAGDVLKGFLSAWAGCMLFAAADIPALYGGYLAAVLAVIGHWKPLYFGFKGGKGILVAAGTILALRPGLVPVMAAIFLAFFLPTKMVSLGSIMMSVSYPLLTFGCGALLWRLPTPQLAFSTACAAIMGGLILYMHRANIQRIRAGTEYRFDGKHKKQ